jgi:hypothetical protein
VYPEGVSYPKKTRRVQTKRVNALFAEIEPQKRSWRKKKKAIPGSLVKDVYGTVWKVKQRVAVAIDPPAQNAYYSYVRAGERMRQKQWLANLMLSISGKGVF